METDFWIIYSFSKNQPSYLDQFEDLSKRVTYSKSYGQHIHFLIFHDFVEIWWSIFRKWRNNSKIWFQQVLDTYQKLPNQQAYAQKCPFDNFSKQIKIVKIEKIHVLAYDLLYVTHFDKSSNCPESGDRFFEKEEKTQKSVSNKF